MISKKIMAESKTWYKAYFDSWYAEYDGGHFGPFYFKTESEANHAFWRFKINKRSEYPAMKFDLTPVKEEDVPKELKTSSHNEIH